MLRNRFIPKAMPLLLSVVLCFGLASCRESDTDPNDSSTQAPETDVPAADYDGDFAPPVSYERVEIDTFDQCLIHGRTLPPEKGRLVLEWSWSGFTLRGWFDGPVEAGLSVTGPTGALLRVSVDGGESVPHRLTEGDHTVTLASVERGYHTITVRKTTEGSRGVATVKLLAFCGVLDEPPEAPALKIEFIGDSITNAMGAYPAEVAEWDPLLHCDTAYSYATMTAEALNADAHLISVSGIGVSLYPLPPLYGLASPQTDSVTAWDFAAWQPDVVVIALGTNDGGMAHERFYPEALSFLKTVREKNPDAYIVWMYEMFESSLVEPIQAAIAEMNDGRIVYLKRTNENCNTGGWGHPSYEAQCGHAEALLDLLRPIVSGS